MIRGEGIVQNFRTNGGDSAAHKYEAEGGLHVLWTNFYRPRNIAALSASASVQMGEKKIKIQHLDMLQMNLSKKCFRPKEESIREDL